MHFYLYNTDHAKMQSKDLNRIEKSNRKEQQRKDIGNSASKNSLIMIQ